MDYRKLVNESPAVIGMITSTLQSGGSVDTAIRSIAESGPKLSRIIFAQAVRTTDTKGYPSLKGALTEILSDLPKDSSGYCRAVMMILSASESSDSETRERMLRDSADISLDSVREMGESYGASLTVPCMTVFGIGIMVPMILMSILPMLNVGGMFGSKSLDQGTIVMVTLAIVPSFIMMVALYLRNKNPFLNGDILLTDMRYGAPLIASIPLAIIYLAVETDDDWMLLFSLAPSCIATLILMSDTMYKETKRRKCEMSLMDSVFDIGNRMLSGYNFERAGVDSMHSRNLHLISQMRCRENLHYAEGTSVLRFVPWSALFRQRCPYLSRTYKCAQRRATMMQVNLQLRWENNSRTGPRPKGIWT